MSARQALDKSENLESAEINFQWSWRVLIVEDEPGIAESYKEILGESTANIVPIKRSSRSKNIDSVAAMGSDFPFEVTVCHSADDALLAIADSRKNNQPFAMGFFDVMLGGDKDGFDLVKEIHKTDPDIYAVFVTAYNDRSIDSIHEHLGIDKAARWDYINKPFTASEIVQKARNFVSLWNLQKERAYHAKQLGDLHRKLLDSERFASVATVSRGVGHEFGNLLMQILGNADVAKNKGEDEMRKALNKIIDASQRAGDILDRFKDLSESGDDVRVKEDESINKILDEALELMEHQFKNTGVKICKIKNDKVSCEVNSTALLQTIVNLSLNSIFAMSRSGGQIDYAILRSKDYVEIKIRDYGPGIPPQVLGKVTEAFFTTKGKQGTGLGLAICKEIVEIEHQGKFSIRNHETMGVEVTIQIPFVQES